MAGAGWGLPSPEERDWAGGLPPEVLGKVVEKLVALAEPSAAKLKRGRWSETRIQEIVALRKVKGISLFAFMRVCTGWRTSVPEVDQRKLWPPRTRSDTARVQAMGRLCTRWESDVIAPGRVALVKWALAEGCPRERYRWWVRGTGPYNSEDVEFTMATVAAKHGHLELVKWLCGEGGFAMDWTVMYRAAGSGNLELVRWLRAKGCLWNYFTCDQAVVNGHVEVLRWARENGCEWCDETRYHAEEELGYTDDFGNLYAGN